MSTQNYRLTLSDLATVRPQTGTVNIRGREVNVRPPTLHEQNLLRLNHAAPVPPQWKNPEKGSMAPLEPNYEDPDFVSQIAVHRRESNLLLAAIAIDYAPAPTRMGFAAERCVEAAGRNGGIGEWIAATLKDLQGSRDAGGALTSTDVAKIMDKVQELENGGPSVGNSLAPLAGDATPAPTSDSPAPAASTSKTSAKGGSRGATTASP